MDTPFTSLLRARLAALGPPWHEARLNVEIAPHAFPAWRVDFGGMTLRGGRWVPVATVIVVVEYSEDAGVEVELERWCLAMVHALRSWPAGILRSVSAAQILSFGDDPTYFGATLVVEKT